MWALWLLAACEEEPGAVEDAATGVFAEAVVRFAPGEGAGFGADRMPDIVLGPPLGAGPKAGSLDVVSLGREGEIVLDLGGFFDGDGVDLIVFENPFPGWLEPGVVGVSGDGEVWAEWTCDAGVEGFPGCAGVTPVLSHPENGLDPFDLAAAGGDGFDLAELGLTEARYVRVRDTGFNDYAGEAGGFDLDAVAAVHPAP